MGMDLYVSEFRNPDREGVELSRWLLNALGSERGYIGTRLPPPLARRLEPEPSEDPDRLTPRDPAALKAGLQDVRDLVVTLNDELPLLYRFNLGNGHQVGSGVVVPYRGVDWTDPAERRARLVTDHGDRARRDQIQVAHLRPHPDAVKWARRYRDRSWWERKRDDVRSAQQSWRVIPNSFGGTPDPPRSRFEEIGVEWIPYRPVIEVLGERIGVERHDAVDQCVPSLDRAIEVCERAERAGRPVF